jgi:hypothetical protein
MAESPRSLDADQQAVLEKILVRVLDVGGRG